VGQGSAQGPSHQLGLPLLQISQSASLFRAVRAPREPPGRPAAAWGSPDTWGESRGEARAQVNAPILPSQDGTWQAPRQGQPAQRVDGGAAYSCADDRGPRRLDGHGGHRNGSARAVATCTLAAAGRHGAAAAAAAAAAGSAAAQPPLSRGSADCCRRRPGAAEPAQADWGDDCAAAVLARLAAGGA
jgi:hypothetical protein